jgi:hypothetical protein
VKSLDALGVNVDENQVIEMLRQHISNNPFLIFRHDSERSRAPLNAPECKRLHQHWQAPYR